MSGSHAVHSTRKAMTGLSGAAAAGLAQRHVQRSADRCIDGTVHEDVQTGRHKRRYLGRRKAFERAWDEPRCAPQSGVLTGMQPWKPWTCRTARTGTPRATAHERHTGMPAASLPVAGVRKYAQREHRTCSRILDGAREALAAPDIDGIATGRERTACDHVPSADTTGRWRRARVLASAASTNQEA